MEVRPPLLYGTAWKKGETARLVAEALARGFRGIDTAGQPKHYNEKGCGEGIWKFLTSKGEDIEAGRASLFIQSKFTLPGGQDLTNMPYDPESDIPTQVKTSFAQTLENLRTSYLDSYLLHGPTYRDGLCEEDWKVWACLEKLQKEQKVRHIGISNVSAAQLETLCRGAAIKPAFVQNRCYASRQWDSETRRVCAEHGIVYQGFSLLTANPTVLEHPFVRKCAARMALPETSVVFQFARSVGMLPLTGTCDRSHMDADLKAAAATDERTNTLTDEEVAAIERICRVR